MIQKSICFKLTFLALFSISFLALACDQATTPPADPPPATTAIRLTLQSDGTETVDATHPIRWEISTISNFSTIAKSGTVSTASATTFDVAVDAGGYFVRAYIDKDNNGSLSYGDTFSINGLPGDTQLIYFPYKTTVAAGETKSVSLSPGVGEATENNSDIPNNFGTIYFTLSYTGTGTVDTSHWLYLGVGTNPNLTTRFMGFSIHRNGEKVYAIVPAGTWYAGGFFDIDGDAVRPDGMPDSGDPTEIYDNIVYNGTNTGSPITVTAGAQTDVVPVEFDDTLLYP